MADEVNQQVETRRNAATAVPAESARNQAVGHASDVIDHAPSSLMPVATVGQSKASPTLSLE